MARLENLWLMCFCSMPDTCWWLTIKKYNILNQQSNILSTVTPRLSCWSQILVKMKRRAIKVSPWYVSMSCLKRLKSAMHFLLHWRKLAGNLTYKANATANGKSSYTLCLTTPCPTWGKYIQVALVYWHLWMIFFLKEGLSFVSRE